MKPTFVMMCGISGSGKSSFAEKLGYEIFSSDKIRDEWYGGVYDSTQNVKIFEELHRRIQKCLTEGRSCIYDATNLSADRRKKFLHTLSFIDCKKICFMMVVPLEECIRRVRSRAEKGGLFVPEEDILSQFKKVEIPHKREGWDEISLIPSEAGVLSLEKYLKGHTSHDCAPYHLESIEEHCKMTEYIADKEGYDPVVCAAARYHDIGKIFTKYFDKDVQRCRYSGHEGVGAYLFLLSKEAKSFSFLERKEIAYLIQFHMKSYELSPADFVKFAKDFSGDFIIRLLQLYKSDKRGRIRAEDVAED